MLYPTWIALKSGNSGIPITVLTWVCEHTRVSNQLLSPRNGYICQDFFWIWGWTEISTFTFPEEWNNYPECLVGFIYTYNVHVLSILSLSFPLNFQLLLSLWYHFSKDLMLLRVSRVFLLLLVFNLTLPPSFKFPLSAHLHSQLWVHNHSFKLTKKYCSKNK